MLMLLLAHAHAAANIRDGWWNAKTDVDLYLPHMRGFSIEPIGRRSRSGCFFAPKSKPQDARAALFEVRRRREKTKKRTWEGDKHDSRAAKRSGGPTRYQLNAAKRNRFALARLVRPRLSSCLILPGTARHLPSVSSSSSAPLLPFFLVFWALFRPLLGGDASTMSPPSGSESVSTASTGVDSGSLVRIFCNILPLCIANILDWLERKALSPPMTSRLTPCMVHDGR